MKIHVIAAFLMLSVVSGHAVAQEAASPRPSQTEPPASSPKIRVGDRVVPGERDIKLRDIHNGWFWRVSEMCFPGEPARNQQKKTVVMDFFSTGCEPCKRMLDHLVSFAKNHADKVQVLLVAVPEKDDAGGRRLRAFFERKPVPFPVLEDPSGYYSLKWLPQNGGAAEMPFLFLIDREGVVRATVPGYHDSIDAALSPALEAALEH